MARIVNRPTPEDRVSDVGFSPTPVPTAYQGPAVPVVYGTARVPARVAAYLNPTWFVPLLKRDSTTGVWSEYKGPSATVVLAICEAPIASVKRAFKDGLVPLTNPSSILYLCAKDAPYTVVTSSTPPALPYLSGTAGAGMAFQGTAYFASQNLALDEDGRVPDITFEVTGRCINAGGVHADPADVVVDLLTNTRFGIGLSAAQVVVDLGIDGLAASSFRTYCTAMGFEVSRAISTQEDAAKLLSDLLLCTNSEAVWSEGKLIIVPWGDTAVGSYVPPATAAALDPDQFVVAPGADPVTVERVPDSEVFNCWPVSIANADADYNSAEYEAQDVAHVSLNRLRRAASVTAGWITKPALALKLSSLLALRSITQRNTYRFKLKSKWALLDQMDYVSLTEPVMGLSNVLCRVQSIKKLEDGSLEVGAIEAPQGTATPVALSPQAHDGFGTEVKPAYIADAKADAAAAQSTATAAQTAAGNAQTTANTAVAGLANKALTDLSNVPDSSVTPRLLAAQSVLAKNMVVADWDNLWPNPNGDTTKEPAGWTGPGDDPEFAYAAVVADSVTGYAHHLVAGGSEVNAAVVVPAKEGENFYFEARAIRRSGANNAGLYWSAYDKSGAILTGNGSPSAGGTWGPISCVATMPANTVKLRIYVYAQAGVTADFTQLYLRRMAAGKIIVDGEITADKFAGNVIKTPNYAFTGTEGTSSEVATAGAKLQNTPSGQALLIGPLGAKIGSTVLDEPILASLTAIARVGTTTQIDRVWYRGNIDTRARYYGGAPCIVPPLMELNAAYVVGEQCRPPTAQTVYECTTAGTTGASQTLPVTAPAVGTTFTVGTAVFTYKGLSSTLERVCVYGRPSRDTGSWITLYSWDFAIYPRTIWDNLDSITQLEAVMCSSNGTQVGTAGTQFYVKMPDRQYAHATDGNGANAVRVTHTILAECNPVQYNATASPWCPSGYLKVRLYNSYGFSEWRGFGPGPNVQGNPWPFVSTIGAGTAGGGATGGGSTGGSCVSPEARILLANGTEVPAGLLRIGDSVWTVPDGQDHKPDHWGAYEVTDVQIVPSVRRMVVFNDGSRIVTSPGHRFLVSGGTGYVPVDELRAGDLIAGRVSKVVKQVTGYEAGDVVKITVRDAHTYVSDGLMSHNAKRLP
jgi:hypothetical protein